MGDRFKETKKIVGHLVDTYITPHHAFDKGNFPMQIRHLVLDTETTGLYPHRGDRMVEIAVIELINMQRTGRVYHQRFNPERLIHPEASAVHGITNEMVKDEPTFPEKVDELLQFLGTDATVVIHNAQFDMGFLNSEIDACREVNPFTRYEGNPAALSCLCTLLDARNRWPYKKNNLNAVCERLDIDTSHRELHGALLDAELLVEVFIKTSTV